MFTHSGNTKLVFKAINYQDKHRHEHFIVEII